MGRPPVVRYYVAIGVAGGSFARASPIAAARDELLAAGATEVSFEVVSGVLVSVGFAVEAESADDAELLACELLWATSLERVGPVAVAELAVSRGRRDGNEPVTVLSGRLATGDESRPV